MLYFVALHAYNSIYEQRSSGSPDRGHVMIKNSKQAWVIGQQVNVGFLKGLTVLAAIATPGDYAPDAYVLARGASFYSFVPHNGLTRIDQNHAEWMIEDGKRTQARLDAKAKTKADTLAASIAFQNSIIAAA